MLDVAVATGAELLGLVATPVTGLVPGLASGVVGLSVALPVAAAVSEGEITAVAVLVGVLVTEDGPVGVEVSVIPSSLVGALPLAVASLPLELPAQADPAPRRWFQPVGAVGDVPSMGELPADHPEEVPSGAEPDHPSAAGALEQSVAVAGSVPRGENTE